MFNPFRRRHCRDNLRIGDRVWSRVPLPGNLMRRVGSVIALDGHLVMVGWDGLLHRPWPKQEVFPLTAHVEQGLLRRSDVAHFAERCTGG